MAFCWSQDDREWWTSLMESYDRKGDRLRLRGNNNSTKTPSELESQSVPANTLKGLEGHEIDTCASLNENMIKHSSFHNNSGAEGSCLEGSYVESLGLEGSELRKCRFKMLRPCLNSGASDFGSKGLCARKAHA
ncbi:hypothetical protein QJS10_CPB18g02078 [Acorus calamus]|uniref:Uncharacterized protein n=1 Tax=Acorus calamus TaxID=4465 RepID=A0AAV9CMK8_ACOCL|nr:hypothetical protein QJS10_CPB18g02078 [Acorus calamus]